MAKPFFEHATPQEHFDAINNADFDIRWAMIERDIAAVESAYSLNIKLADYKVMTENGSFEDLEFLYTEASEQKTKDSRGIFDRVIDLIKDIFAAFKKMLFGDKADELEEYANSDEAKNTKLNKSVNTKAVEDSMNIVQRTFNRVKDFVTGKGNAGDVSDDIADDNKTLGETIKKIFVGTTGTVTLASGLMLILNHSRGISTFHDNISDCIKAAQEKGSTEFVGVMKGFLKGLGEFIGNGLIGIIDIIKSQSEKAKAVIEGCISADTLKSLPSSISAALSQVKNEHADKEIEEIDNEISKVKERLDSASSEDEKKRYQKRLDNLNARKDKLEKGIQKRTEAGKNFNFKSKEEADKKVEELQKEVDALKEEIEKIYKNPPVDKAKAEEKETALEQKEDELHDAKSQAADFKDEKKDDDSKDSNDSAPSTSSEKSGNESSQSSSFAVNGRSYSKSTDSAPKGDDDGDSSEGITTYREDVTFIGKDDKEYDFTTLNEAHALLNKGERYLAQKDLTRSKTLDKYMARCDEEATKMAGRQKSLENAGEKSDASEKYVLSKNYRSKNSAAFAMYTKAVQALREMPNRIKEKLGESMKSLRSNAAPDKITSIDVYLDNVSFENAVKSKSRMKSEIDELIAAIDTKIANETDSKKKKLLEDNKSYLNEWLDAYKDIKDKYDEALSHTNRNDSNYHKSTSGETVEEILEKAKKAGFNISDVNDELSKSISATSTVKLSEKFMSPLSEKDLEKMSRSDLQEALGALKKIQSGKTVAPNPNDDSEKARNERSLKKNWENLGAGGQKIIDDNVQLITGFLSDFGTKSKHASATFQKITQSTTVGELKASISSLKNAIDAKSGEYEKLRKMSNKNELDRASKASFDKLGEELADLRRELKYQNSLLTNSSTLKDGDKINYSDRPDDSGISSEQKSANTVKDTFISRNTLGKDITDLLTSTISLSAIPSQRCNDPSSTNSPPTQLDPGSLRAKSSNTTLADLGVTGNIIGGLIANNGTIDYTKLPAGILPSNISQNAEYMKSFQSILLPAKVVNALSTIGQKYKTLTKNGGKVTSQSWDGNAKTYTVTVESVSAFGVGFSDSIVLTESCDEVDLSEYDSDINDILDNMDEM